MNQTNQPENQDKYSEECWINHSQEGQTDFPIWLFHPSGNPVRLLGPGLPGFNRQVVLSESVYVGLHDDVHEGFEETEDEPAVNHLDVGSVGEVCVDAKKISIKLVTKHRLNIFLTKNVVRTSMTVTFMAMIPSKEYLK